jgi:hypothetical protein
VNLVALSCPSALTVTHLPAASVIAELARTSAVFGNFLVISMS